MNKILNYFNVIRKYRNIKFHNQLLIFLYSNEINQRKNDFEEMAELKAEVKRLKKKYNQLKKLK